MTCVTSVQGPFCFAVTADEYTWNGSVRKISAITNSWRITFYLPWAGITRKGDDGDEEDKSPPVLVKSTA